MNIKLVACEVMKEELLSVTAMHNTEIHFIPMGFHLYPEKLHKELEEILSKSSGYDRVVLSFGLCGGAAKNLKAPGSILTIPRIHDCIPILLGSSEIFKEQQLEKGTFYLSCGWFKSDKTILSEHKRLVDKYGRARAEKVTAKLYNSYRRILFINTGHPDEKICYEKSQETARLLDLKFHTTQGRREYLEKIINGPWDDWDFINVEPDGIILEDDFF
ncbi:MAG: hypothetical protein K0R50_2971 [Eubacterium sp.]|jgi:hypothetical protein|nr:hypothetical protein [Eubacterium sp.]